MSQIMEMPSCWWCGEKDSPLMAQASRPSPKGLLETRYFCHTNARRCYEKCSGHYFDVPRNGGKK